MIYSSPHISTPSKEKVLPILVELARDWEKDCFNIVRELAGTLEYNNARGRYLIKNSNH